jgi:hypothetical protein
MFKIESERSGGVMREVWLASNRRALLIAMLPAWLLLSSGLLLSLWLGIRSSGGIVAWLAAGVACLTFSWAVWLLVVLRHPRLAYQQGELLVFLTPSGPFRVPVELVECFFLGQGPSHLSPGKDEPTAANVIVRLAESSHPWKEIHVQAHLGKWSDGYITIRGAWCEPIDETLVKKMNHRLAEVHRAAKVEAAGEK